ncbi:hypothetical protein O181_097338 [Austropuccinia psidii MF-1]|uniref:RNI-like protein n=1 Tax=Austropuccinia psidii MF-1 TaxID=1389203 RepID=A0A9Q3J8R2_9BASI|nr:hypothetical protein [Austropuccinia psidii MF-1]
MSSFFPFLRLLLSPSGSARNDVHHSIIHQTIKDRDRGGFTTPTRRQSHLSYHDTGLRGAQSALIVLEALATNPFASQLTLSHNALGDAGVRQLASRIRFLKSRRVAQIQELNLASNGLTDVGFSDLLRGWSGLAELFLSNNQIQLQASPSPMLFLGNLTFLSLTSNPIHCPSIVALFANSSFAPPELNTLHLSACGLDTAVAFALALWLEDTQRSKSLEFLAVNGNNWGIVGCERIAWALGRKNGNRNILRLEMLACAEPTTNSENQQFFQVNDPSLVQPTVEDRALQMGFQNVTELQECRLALDREGGWKSFQEKCETRNQILKLATRRAAIGLVAAARLILLSSPGPSVSEPNTFPWNRLPEEIQYQVWRWVALLSAFPGLRHHSHDLRRQISSDSTSSFACNGLTFSTSDMKCDQSVLVPDPLTVNQFSRLLDYARNRATLEDQIGLRMQFFLEHNALSENSSFHRRMVEGQRLVGEADRMDLILILKCVTLRTWLGSALIWTLISSYQCTGF